jgi:hypothetical protein
MIWLFAGLGVPSLTIAHMGAREVVVTDVSSGIPLLADNIALKYGAGFLGGNGTEEPAAVQFALACPTPTTDMPINLRFRDYSFSINLRFRDSSFLLLISECDVQKVWAGRSHYL